MTDYETLTLTRDGAVARLAFNRQSTLNSINITMRRELLAAAREVNLDDSIRIVELTGEGRAFGSGADLSEDDGQGGLMMGERTRDALINEFGPAVSAIVDAPKVWVAAVNGPCAGISYSFAMACDFVVMAQSAFLYQPFAAIGLVPDGGSTWLTEKLIGSRRALEMMVMGEKIPAEKALEWGMVNRVFADDSFRQETAAFLADLALRSPLALRYTKEALRYATTASLSESIVKEAFLQEKCINSEDSSNAIVAFFEKRPYEWKGR
jgi:2-(1,2-epoxy-1,2-dihydrophenyl)acetyl-CoA isomerase